MEEKAIKIMDFILNTLQTTKDFVIEQAPDVVRQMLNYDLINCITWMFVFIFIIIVGILLFKPLKKFAYKYNDESDGVSFIPIILVTITTFICGMIFLTNLYDKTSTILQIKYTPKAYLIYKLTDKINGKEKDCK
jgi:hypothetical protein